MNIKKFIEESFQKIQLVFPSAKLEYQYKDISATHFIKVIPSSIFDKDEYIDLDFELTDTFYKYGFEGSLCFITTDSLTELDNPTVIYEPKAIVNTVVKTGEVKIFLSGSNIDLFDFDNFTKRSKSFFEAVNHVQRFSFSEKISSINILDIPMKSVENKNIEIEKSTLITTKSHRSAMAA